MSAVEPIAIIGIGCRLPGGVRSPDDLWKLLAGEVDAIVEIPKERWHLSAMYHPDSAKPGRMNTRWGGFLDHIDRFDAQFFGITPREAAPADPQQRQLLEVAYETVEDAGLTMAALAGRPVGVYVGISSYDYGAMQLNPHDRGTIGPYTNLGSALCIAANRISYFFNLIGPSLAVDTACSSSLVATHLACQSIWNGESELAFAAGVNAIIRAEGTIGGAKASMLSPDGRCKSFDSRANGYVRSEGVAVVILKPLTRALADRDRIYSVIRATAVNQDGRTDGISVPNRASQEANLRTALRRANIAPESVQYVEAHGTGTPVGDPIEAAALGAVYGQARQREERCVIGSIKSNVGHLESASGITGLIKTALSLQHRQIPASLHFERPNPQIPFDDLQLRVAQRLEPWPQTNGLPPRAGVNSFGFGGTNGHAILEAPPAVDAGAEAQRETGDGRAWLLPLSARTASALPDLARAHLNSLREEQGLNQAALRDICFSAGVKRTHHEFRLAIAAHDNAELIDELDAFLRGEARANSSSGRKSEEPLRPVFICSGMGQQWWAMGRELLAQEAVYRRAVEDVSERFGELAGWSLLDKMTADEKASQIQDTRFGQPALFALQVGLAALWRSWGVEPAAVVGHSAGELAASYISGALSLEDAVLVAFHRSRLQQRMAGQGTMLAAGISSAEAVRLVERHPRAISIAAVNSPGSVTLSGDASVLAEIDQALNEAGQFSRILQVDVPYHSPKMEQFESEALECLRDLKPRPASTPFFSTVTGAALAGSELNAGYWYRNIRQPVLFLDVMRELVKAGHWVFLEVGAHPILRYDIAACLNEKSSHGTTLCSLRRNDRERATLLGTLGRLYTLGAEIDWPKQFPADATAVKLPRYPFQAESHWQETDQSRVTRVGQSIHPLLGNRLEAPKPSWQVALDIAGLGYLQDHRIGSSIVFPGAGYVEMALAVGREMFGPVPCVLEDIEFSKFLFLDEEASCSAQVVLDADSSSFDIYTRADAADHSWDLHAHGCVRQAGQATPATIDLATIRRQDPDAIGAEEHYRLFADLGFHYGPTFRGIAQLWRGEREALAEIRVPPALGEHLSDYRLHPAVLDACIQSVLATLPARTVWQATQGRPYVPVKIERLYFHGTPSTRLFAYSRLKGFNPTELTADIQIVDESGHCLVDMQGLVCRPTGNRVRRANSTVYEYQWALQPQRTTSAVRDSHHLASLDVLDPIMQAEGELLRQRFDRARYQNEFQSQSRTAAVAYITRALRELGWTPALAETEPVETLAARLDIAQQHQRLLALFLRELTAEELASTDDPQQCWKALWDGFPEYHAESKLFRQCGENLAAVLRDEVDPLNLIFPQGTLTLAEHLYEDSLTFRLNNLLVQKAMIEIVQRLPKGKALRVLEIGGGTGGMTSFVLPVLPEHCSEYLFTDISSRFIPHAQHKFAQYPFVQCRTLDIERDPLEQRFDAHSYDLIVASDVLHATKDLRQTLERVKQLLGSGGMLVLLEMTRPWLGSDLIFGMLKGWWLFEDHDLRPDEPCLSPDQWQKLLREAGFSGTICIGDGLDADNAQHSVILARGPELCASPPLAPETAGEPNAWLLLADDDTAGRPSAASELALQLRERGDHVIQVMRGADFRQVDNSRFQVRTGDADDMSRLLTAVGKQTPQLAGVVHLWSLDSETTEATMSDALMSAVTPGCIGVLQLVRALAATENLVTGGLWLVTRLAQPIENRAGTLQVAQSPLWGLGKVIASEYRNLRCRMVDLTTCCREEIASLAQELSAADDTEDEIALHGELRYLHRFVAVSPGKVHGMGRRFCTDSEPFRIELPPTGILDSLSARSIARRPPGPNEVEIEVVATGLNFRDLMKAMGLLPKDAGVDDPAGELLGVECAGRVVAVGDAVSQFSIGDEVVACGTSCLATHITGDWRHAVHKPRHLTFEQAATIPVAFSTAHYAFHGLARIQRGERVLIHSATGGVGLAAVQLALNAGAIVFATAGSPEKRDLLTQLGVPHVMDSRSLAFADEVMKLTGGEGVDVVLNSLAGEAIDKNLSIVRARGRIVEIGKIDIYKNRKIGMRPLRNNISLFCLDMNSAVQRWPDLAQSLLREVMALFESHDLHPLPHRVFPAARVADAFRYMAQAKHVGKLIVSVQDRKGLEIEREPRSLVIDPDASYLISGGLGGLGLAVADRLARHGARHLALVGRSDPSPSAQAAVDALRRRGVEVMTFRSDIADRELTQRVIADVQRRMGPLRGIMHAAMVLDDAPIEHLTEERMWKAMAPKMMGAWNLHSLTVGAPLDFFVLFSSMSAVIGNPGQANYVAGNAFLDALAYYRRAQGRPALTVDWGMVGEVGHLANIPEAADRLGRFGIRPMPVSETLDALDELIASNAVQVAVVEVEWKDLLRLTASRTLARFAGVLGETDGEDGRSKTSSRVREMLEADEATLAPLLETYIRDHLARAMGASPARIDVQQSLVSLGLDSLIAVEVRNRINADLGMNVPLAKFMQGASINSLAAYIAERLLHGDRSERAKTPPQGADAAAGSEIVASSRSAAEPTGHTGAPTDARAPGRSLVADTSSRHDPFPLTDVQRAYWLGRSSFFELGKVACHVYLEFDITNLDREQVQAAWRTLVERHEMLRAVIRDDGLQQILRDVPKYEIEHRNLRGVADAQQLVDAIRERMSHQVLPADRWPLFELRTSQLERQTLLHMSLDLLTIDFWSIQILLDEWLRLSLDPDLRLAPLEVSFRDYVVAAASRRDSPSYRRAEEYWRQRLGTLAPPPKLPFARSPSAVTRQRFIRRQAVLDSALWQRLKNRSGRVGLTPSVTLMAAFAKVLAAWSREPDFTLTLTFFERMLSHPQVNQLVGDFTSILLLEVHVGAAESFEALAKRMATRLWSDLEHGSYSGVQLLQEMAKQGARPAAPIVFTSALGLNTAGLDSVESPGDGPGNITYSVSQTPQVALDHQVYEQGGRLFLSWDAVEDLFPPGLIDDMFEAYRDYVRRLAQDETAWSETSVSLLPPAQIARRAAMNDTDAPVPAGLLHTPFLEQARVRPQQTAVVTADLHLSYQDVHQRAQRLARLLRRMSARTNHLVAVVMEKGWEQVVAVLAVLEAGAAYLPVDPDLPQERRWLLLQRGEAKIVLTQSWLAQRLDWPAGTQCLSVDRDSGEDDDDPAQPQRTQSGEDLAYVMFTSGSTGEPKGVMIDHRSALNTILDINQRFAVGPDDRILALSSLSFDLSVYDIFGALAAGATIVMPRPASWREPGDWVALVAREGVTIWNSVPALLEMVVSHVGGRKELLGRSLRLALLSGDWIPVRLADRARALVAGLELMSLGGATEASIWSIFYRIGSVAPDWTSIPYGQPLRNQSMHVLNDAMEPCPTWVPGQLFIGGIGLARGYWRDDVNTDAQFVRHPQSGQRLYRTGDMGRYLPDGNIELMGREDNQVKLQGYRIELEEIEATLVRHPAVKAALVAAPGEPTGPKQLVAYVVADAVPVDELTLYLRQKLPSYMVPAIWEKLDALPLTANGKVNRKALPQAQIVGRPPLRSSSATQAAVAEIWSTALGREGVGLQDNFFELGGTSLAAVVILTKIRERLQIEIPAAVLFEHPTIQSMADEIECRMLEDGSAHRRAGSCLVPIQPTGSKAPVFCVPPIGGTVYSYLALASHLGPDQPVYGLQGTGLDADSEHLGSIEDLAGRYVEAIRAIQPAGPYLLAGWSLGGQIAFEMAQQITRRGEKVALVALFDSFLAPGGHEFDAEHWLGEARWAGILQQGASGKVREVVRTHLQAWATHKPCSYAGDVLLFVASEHDIFSRYRGADRWRGLATNGLEVKTVEANHFTLMHEPHIGPVAQHLAAAFDRALNHAPADAGETRDQ